MLIIIADRGVMTGVAIQRALLESIPEIDVVTCLSWNDYKNAERKPVKGVASRLAQGPADTIVLSAWTVKGFSSPGDFAAKVKTVREDVPVYVYNGAQFELFAEAIEAYLPACRRGESVESVVVPFFRKVIEGWKPRFIQMGLF